MTPLLMWAIVLLLLGLGLIVMEAFIPSAGILGGAAALAVLAAVGMAFYSSPVHGVLMLTAAIVATPVCVALVLRWWPHTPIGRRILLQVPTSEDVARDNPRLRELQALLGQVGRAKNVMLPSGPVEIGGRIIDAVSEGMPIDAGQAVEVVEVRGVLVVVRPTDGSPEDSAAPKEGDDVLSRPIDSLGIDPFGDAVS